MTPKDKTAVPMTWTGKSSRKEARMSFVQKAHALELKIKSVEDNIITLDAGATGINWSADIAVATLTNGDNDAIKVWRNGSRLLFTDNASNDGEFTYAGTPDKIRLKSNLVPGETYTIYVKAGDAEGETVTFHVGGPALSSVKQEIEYGETYLREPVFYGLETPHYEWAIDAETYATINTTSGVVSTVAPGNATITLKTTAIAPADGWVYDTSDKTYEVEVKKAAGKIKFETKEPPAQTKTKGNNVEIYKNEAKLTNSKGHELTPGSDTGTINYDIVSVNDDDNHPNKSSFSVTDGILKNINKFTPDGVYKILVKASVGATNTNADYDITEDTYTIIVTLQ